ncbi:acyl carrier protein [Hydrocarboniphaga effusa]|jgi:acyl carrier protein|uniref:acyl carrier protein n=1 Tax=Hydrocarboniphaga effusa TaxID=243629 RepID=UPI00398BDFF6
METVSAVVTDEEIVALLRKAFAFAKPDQLEAAAQLQLSSTIDELGIESVSALEMTGFIEEELDIQFHDSELVRIHGMGDLAQLIRKHTTARQET